MIKVTHSVLFQLKFILIFIKKKKDLLAKESCQFTNKQSETQNS